MAGSGVLTRALPRGDRGALAMDIWYPSSSAGSTPQRDAPVASGSWPMVIFSHGLRGLPEDYEALVTRWAANGFVVVAPRYPMSNREAENIDATDVKNQPGDASAALDAVLNDAAKAGDPFNGRLDDRRIFAAGHSEGGVTTVGLLDECCRDARLKGALVLAGNSLGFPGSPAGNAIPVLFIHGDKDRLAPLRATLQQDGVNLDDQLGTA
ncbi:MAG: alpha/beta hydrolase family protein [Acidimicrobiales bacterium]